MTTVKSWHMQSVRGDTGLLSAEIILDSTLLPAILIAMTAGLLSFLSPCVLPVALPYLAYMGGVTVNDMQCQCISCSNIQWNFYLQFYMLSSDQHLISTFY